MKVIIFKDKHISIPDEIVREYEDTVKPFTPEAAEYLAVTSDCTPESSAEELRNGVLEGIREEIYVISHRNEILDNALKSGGIKL